MNRCKWICVLTTVLAALSAAPAAAQRDSVDLQRILDQPVSLHLPDAPIGEVFARLEKTAGAKFVIDEETLASLPYGPQTRLAVTLKDVTLRKALSPMLSPQALKWEIDGDTIRIQPTEALCRMCRRAAFEELIALGKLHSETLQPTAVAGSVIEQLRKITGQQNFRIFFHVRSERPDEEAAYKRAENALPATPAVWLNRVCHGKNWTWYLRGEDVVIIDKVDQTRRQLQRKISLRYQNSPLINVLLDLARKGRIRLTLTPAVMKLLPLNTRENFNLVMADASIDQALEIISGATGLEFVRTPKGDLHVKASETLKSESAASGQRRGTRARFFVRMTLPGPGGSGIEVFMRPEELPKDVLERIVKAKEKFIAELRSEDAE